MMSALYSIQHRAYKLQPQVEPIFHMDHPHPQTFSQPGQERTCAHRKGRHLAKLNKLQRSFKATRHVKVSGSESSAEA